MFDIQAFPPTNNLESTAVLKKAISANKQLAYLNGLIKTIPNQQIIINTLALQEAKDSSEIENIITTHDNLYKADVNIDFINSLAEKEVARYRDALLHGFDLVRQNKFLTANNIIDIQTILENNDAGFRKQTGTILKNDKTNATVYTPPAPIEIIALMTQLEAFINDENDALDQLIKMALIHHQFESIHPFYDGNGRTGRIINVLYLVQTGLLDLPILYLSRYINQYKDDYYKLLQSVRDNNDWESWLVFMLSAVESTAIYTIIQIGEIKELMLNYKKLIKENTDIYSQELVNGLFKHPYTTIKFMERELGKHRTTVAKYLAKLVKIGFLDKLVIKNSHYFINTQLYNIFNKEHRLTNLHIK